MTHLLIAYLNNGRYKNAALLSPEGIASFYRPGVETPGDDEFYAMGWYVVTPSASSQEQSNSIEQPLRAIYHPGGSPGFYSYMRVIPDRHLGVVLLMNAQDMLLYLRNNQIGEGIMQLLLEQAPITPRKPLTWFIRPILLAIVLFQAIRVFRAVRRLRFWQQRSRINSALSKKIIRYSLFALAIDAFVFALVFVVPRLQIEIPLMFLVRAIPDISILIFLIALLTIGWGSARTVLAWKILHSDNLY
jgi:hypothetical protein